MSTASRSDELFERACRVLPGGVNSPVRAFKAVGGTPPFIRSGHGSRIVDADGREYIDYVMSYGPLLFGHAPDFVTGPVEEVLRRGTTFGAPTEVEVEIAELVTELVPSVEMVRFVNSGSEATTSAVRLARGATGRTKIVKCAGCFHGSVDALLVTAGSGVATLGIPETQGVLQTLASETIVVEYNDPSSLEETFAKFGGQIAAFIVEPIAANMGLVPPAPGYLELARELTSRHGALLIFDEVISGFRVAPGGAQELYGITPDVTCFGKIIGGGVPAGAYGGRRELMENLAPIGPVYQAGTLSGNPLAMTAGLAVLRQIKSCRSSLYVELDEKTRRLCDGIRSAFQETGIPLQLHQLGSLFTAFFSDHPVTNYATAKQCDTARFCRFFHRLLEKGIYLAPSQYEAAFVSTAHTDEDLTRTIEAMRESLKET